MGTATATKAPTTQILRLNESKRLVFALYMAGALEAHSKANLSLSELVVREVAAEILLRITYQPVRPGKVKKFVFKRYETASVLYYNSEPNSKRLEFSDPYNDAVIRELLAELHKQIIA